MIVPKRFVFDLCAKVRHLFLTAEGIFEKLESLSLHALPAEKLRLAARLFCQGSPLRSDKRKPGALDSADV
jgi:hypothetical protein